MTPYELGPGSLTRQERGDGTHFWLFAYTDASGRRRRKRLGSNKAVAQKRSADIIRKRDLERAGLYVEAAEDVTCAEALDLYMERRARRVRRKDKLGECRRAIERVLREMRVYRMHDIRRDDIRAWRDREEKRVSAATVNSYLDFLTTFLKWAADEGRILAVNPMAGLARAKGPKLRRRRALRESEIQRLLAAADDLDTRAHSYPRSFPRAHMLRLLLKTGARFQACAKLTWMDYDQESRLLRFRAETVKTENGREFPVDDELAELLNVARVAAHTVKGAMPVISDPIMLTPRGNPWVGEHGTAAFRKWLYQALKDAGIEREDAHGYRVDVHALRVAFASRMARARTPIETVRYLGGWKDLKTLNEVYLQVEAEDARADVARVPLSPVGQNEETGNNLPPPRRMAAGGGPEHLADDTGSTGVTHERAPPKRTEAPLGPSETEP